MKNIMIGLILLFTVNLFANQDNLRDCNIKLMDKQTKLFLCDKEQYLVEYTDGFMKTSKKITLISNGKAIVIKDTK